MKEKIIKVLKVAPHCEPITVELVNKLENLQEAVSEGADAVGLIEIIPISDTASLLCNEEGKLIGLEPNRRIGHDIICGTFYVVGEDRHGNLTSLSAKDMDYFKVRFAVPEDISTDEAMKALRFENLSCISPGILSINDFLP